eukprot:CAMPEP_0114243228 /NCGR_PEP_ID=MMETSP0058-20121206/10669_1 /TAXON_ID=36894 /ORGANISM="Pyramimonas parkeae, CCMP726" /LENGTH=350 /DNA_ID=CAMNT_0001356037 /DNA_START=64 /DNA_END=1117 /DNA_ORIENTATION=-
MGKKVLIISTSADKMGEHPTGTWLEEVATPYLFFKASGMEVAIASTKGGEIPVDAGSRGGDFYTEDCKTFEADAAAMKLFKNSLALDSLVSSITKYDVQRGPVGAYLKQTQRSTANLYRQPSIMGKKVLIISTSAEKMGEHPTGTWLEEVATPYLSFKASGIEVAIASTKGGEIPVDAGSRGGDFYTEDCKTFEADTAAMNLFKNSLALDSLVSSITDYDAVYFAGGHGTCTDYPDNPSVISAIEKMYAAGKVVALDCHGPIALTNCKKPNGEPLVKGLAVTGFTDAEETAVGLAEKVPFLIEKKFRELGAEFSAGSDWAPNVAVAGNLVTGQNPASSKSCADKVIELLA